MNRISFIDLRPTQNDLDETLEFCRIMRAIGVIPKLEWKLRMLEDWIDIEQEAMDCEGKGFVE